MGLYPEMKNHQLGWWIFIYNVFIKSSSFAFCLGVSLDKAEEMLKSLSNTTHHVITGYAIVTKNQIINDYDLSEVTFNELSNELIKEYIKTGSPMDKAGAYGIQDGFPLLKELKGSLENVIGLPIEKIKSVLQNALVF